MIKYQVSLDETFEHFDTIKAHRDDQAAHVWAAADYQKCLKDGESIDVPYDLYVREVGQKDSGQRFVVGVTVFSVEIPKEEKKCLPTSKATQHNQ